jgi:anthranilate/para-aminobenzoate synthase component I
MIAVEIDLPPDPVALARRLAKRRGVFVLRSDDAQALRPEDAASSFVGCDPVESVSAILPPPSTGRSSWAGRASAPRWVGFVPYECARSLERARFVGTERRAEPLVTTPRWLRYSAVARVDRRSGRVVLEGDERAAVERLRDAFAGPESVARDFAVGPLEWSDDDATHAAKVRRILDYIRAGDVYQVNLARRSRFRFEGDRLRLFDALSSAAPGPYGFYLALDDLAVAGTSPELALAIEGARLRTAPIKGTRSRGRDAFDDERLVRELDADPKERAELTMAVDLHRNDLGKVAEPRTVRMLGTERVVLGRTVMSRVAEVVATLEAGRSAEDAVRAILPCGSVTGAPKIRAMEVIATLETERRGLYTGLLGTVRRDGSVTLAMAIRTAVLRTTADGAGIGDYFAGGGIVLASDPDREAEETRWKAEHLRRVAEVSSLGRTL